MRISAFGGTTGVYLADQIPVVPVMMGVLSMAVIPAIIVLAIGLSAASPIRDNRFQVLVALGAPKRTLRLIGAMETLLFAVPSLVAATVLWTLVNPHLQMTPVVEQRLVPGDLSIPWTLLLAEVGVAMAICWLTSIALTRTGRQAAPRPTLERQTLSSVAAIPLSLSIGAFALAAVVGSDLAADLNLLGIIFAVAGIPLVMPGVLRSVGRRIGRSDSVTASLAGNALEWDPVRTARPFMGLGALLVLAVVGTGYVSLATYIEPPQGMDTASSAVAVEWRQVQPADLERFTAAMGASLVVPFRQMEIFQAGRSRAGSGVAPPTRGEGLTLGATCTEISLYVSGSPCESQASSRLTGSVRQEVAALLSDAFNHSVGTIRLAPRKKLGDSGHAFVLDDSALPVLDEHVRNVAMSTLPAPSVTSAVSNQPLVPSLVRWISAGLVVAVTILVIGSLLSLVDRLLGSRRRHSCLLNLGVSPQQLTLLGAAMFAVPYSVVAFVALATGFGIFAMMVAFSVPVPWQAVTVIISGTLVVGLVGTVSMAIFGSRQALREHE
ncbi:MAG: hypothetical protein H0V07_09620 [Propionibacteriales bacterium]|nr:hypothetical protein [Propionibacteriales bacterium]